MELKTRHCPICGSSEHSRLFMEANYSEEKMDGFSYSSRKMPEAMHLRMLRCTTCDLLYASPAPSLDNLESAYQQAEFDSGEEAEFASHTYSRLVSKILPKLPDKNGALDIGTGDGVFLERLLELGFSNVSGVEPSQAPIDAAKPHIKPLIIEGLFNPESFAEGSFSLITSFQTLEHVENPKEILEAVHRLLKPGGVFVTVSHNYRSLSAKLMGSKSPIFDIEHLQLFSQKSMKQLLEICGFSEVSSVPISNSYPLYYWLKMLPIGSKLKLSLIKLSKKLKFGYWPVSVYAGNMFVMGRKNA